MGQKVLVVDDEPSVCGVLAEFLKLKGLRAVTTTKPLEAMDLIEKDQPDLVILDLLMPGIDGMETLAIIKKRYPRLPVVILTGMGYAEDIMREALEAGADGFVSKGLFLEQLLMEIRRVLKHPGSQYTCC